MDEAEVAKSKISEKLLDTQHEVLHLRSSLEVANSSNHNFKQHTRLQVTAASRLHTTRGSFAS